MNSLFYEIIDEAYLQKIMIDGEEWPIGFNTIIYDEKGKIKYSKINSKNLNTLVIRDEKYFFNLLEEYLILERKLNRKSVNFLDVSDKNKNKLIISYLFVNATSEDFLRPDLYIKRVISYLKDNTFNYLNNGINIELGDIFDGNILEIKNEEQDIRMETPKKISLKIKNKLDEQESYELPSIYYGITNINGEKECYIYSILNSQKSNDNIFFKKIKRKLYKVNKEVKKGNIFNGKDYDLDDLSLVSPSAVISLTIFIKLLKMHNINIVKGISFLPVRYLSRNIVLDEMENGEKKKLLFDRNIAIQNNATDKFLRTFRRMSYNMEDIEVLTDPYFGADYITLILDSTRNLTNNDLLNEIVINMDKIKKK